MFLNFIDLFFDCRRRLLKQAKNCRLALSEVASICVQELPHIAQKLKRIAKSWPRKCSKVAYLDSLLRDVVAKANDADAEERSW